MFLKRKDIIFLIELFSEKAESKRVSVEFMANAYEVIKCIRHQQTELTRALKLSLSSHPQAFSFEIVRIILDSTAIHPSLSTTQEKILCSQLIRHAIQVPSV